MAPDPLEPLARTLVSGLAIIVAWVVLGAAFPVLSLLAEALVKGAAALRDTSATPAAVPAQAVVHAPPPAPAPKKPKKKKGREQNHEPPLPAQEPPRPETGIRVGWFKGRFSRVRGEFYFDHDSSDRKLIKLFRAHGLTAVPAAAVGMAKADDAAHLEYATNRRMVVVTRDKGFERMHKRGVKHSGIIHFPHGPEWHHEVLRVALRLSMEVVET